MNRSQPTVLSANLSCFAAIFLWAMGFIAAEKLFDSWGAIAMLSTRMVISMTFLILWWGITENWKQIYLAPWKKVSEQVPLVGVLAVSSCLWVNSYLILLQTKVTPLEVS